jgi:hypothetical protein
MSSTAINNPKPAVSRTRRIIALQKDSSTTSTWSLGSYEHGLARRIKFRNDFDFPDSTSDWNHLVRFYMARIVDVVVDSCRKTGLGSLVDSPRIIFDSIPRIYLGIFSQSFRHFVSNVEPRMAIRIVPKFWAIIGCFCTIETTLKK